MGPKPVKREHHIQVCNHCGRSVAFGSGLFVNRVPDWNDIDTRIANGLMYPIGDYVCIECDEKNSDADYCFQELSPFHTD